MRLRGGEKIEGEETEPKTRRLGEAKRGGGGEMLAWPGEGERNTKREVQG